MKTLVIFLGFTVTAAAADVPWQVKAQQIEVCSCDLFCPCYFNQHASHQGTGAHMCTFNEVGVVLKGRYGDVDLTGLKYWLSGRLGDEWATKGQADWLIATFEPQATKEQKDAMMVVLSKLYPLKWSSVEFDTSGITLTLTPGSKTAHAKLANGKGEVTLTRATGPDPNQPPQVTNTRYFGATWNSPFSLYYSDHKYNGFGKSFQVHHGNGFEFVWEETSDGKRMATASAGKGGK